MKILEIQKLLPRVTESTGELDSWFEEFNRLMALADIESPKSIFIWALECVNGRLRGVVQELEKETEDGKIYPSIKEIKEALEEALRITPQEKCKMLQKLKIQRGETIADFNWRYKKLYDSLPKFYQTFVTVDDYIESIKYRPYIRSQVITQRSEDLEDAFEEAELAERAEQIKTSNKVTVMTTLFHGQSNNQSERYQHEYNNNRRSNNYFNTRRNNYNNNYNYNQKQNQRRTLQNNNYFNQRNVNNTEFENKSQNETNRNENIVCFRCGKIGHIFRRCPYTFKQLAEIEERENKEKENNHLN